MKPLTIEELKALEAGDWVWVICLTDYFTNKLSFYFEKDCNGDNGMFGRSNYLSGYLPFDCYEKDWLAYKNKEQAEAKGDLYQTAFELILQDVYDNRLKADTLSCSSCPFMEVIFDECENQGLYKDCKKRWKDYYLCEAERCLAELKERRNE